MKWIQKTTAVILACACILPAFITDTGAALVNTADNHTFKQTSISSGTTGKTMNVTFSYTAERDYENAYIGFAYDEDINSLPEEEKGAVNTYPFETSEALFQRKSIGKIKEGQTRTVTLSAKVRKDIAEGYYGVLVYVSDAKEGGSKGEQEYINIWVKKSTEKESTKEVKSVSFALGEGQPTPSGQYPNVMNFSINLKNHGLITAQDVVVTMVMDKDPTVFPFAINEAKYDRRFEKLAKDESVSLDYSFAIRKEVYTGYYPIKLKIFYKESSEGEIKTAETEFYVDIKNKEKEDKIDGDFNVNNRTKARIIVDSFYTVPERVIAGEPFELVLTMKNASESITASNILFAFEAEKAADSPVFSMENGASSKVINSLGAGASTEIRLNMVSKPAIEQRSYSLKINQKFDSPEFKNAEESVNIDIPVYQISKMKVGTFELVPTDITVGEDINVTFPINNTGKVQLYNVSVKFESDFIKNNEVYVGNIKPGESGNVDVMLTGEQANNGEVTKVVVSYENDAGEVSIEEKEILIPIAEAVEEEIGMEDTTMINEETVQSKNPVVSALKFIIPAVLVLGLLVFIIKKARAKKHNKV